MYCENCGQEIKSKWFYCPKCGEPINTKYKSLHRLRNIIIGIAAVCLFVVCVFMFKLKFTSNNGKMDETSQLADASAVNTLERVYEEDEEDDEEDDYEDDEISENVAINVETAETETETETRYDDSAADMQKVEELKLERDEQLKELQDFTFYVFEEYYDLGIQYHIYDEGSNLGNSLKADILSALGLDNSTITNVTDALVDGISNGDSYNQILSNMYIGGIEGLKDDAVSAIADELLGNSVLSTLSQITSVFTNRTQVEYLLSQLEQVIDSSYFQCLRDVLMLDEWDDDLIFECERKCNNLQALLGKIEELTGNEAGADIWRAYYYNLGAFITEYYRLEEEINFYENIKENIDYDYNLSIEDEVSKYQTLSYDIFYGNNVNELYQAVLQVDECQPEYYYDYKYASDSSIANNAATGIISAFLGSTIGSLVGDSVTADDNERLNALVEFNCFVDDYFNSHAKALNEIRKIQIKFSNLQQLACEDDLTIDDVYRLKELENYTAENTQLNMEQFEELEYSVIISYIVSLAYDNVLAGTNTGKSYANQWDGYFYTLYNLYTYLYGDDCSLLGNAIDEQVLYDAYMDLIETSCQWSSRPDGVKVGELKCFIKGKGDYKVYVYYTEDNDGTKNCFYAKQVDYKGNDMGAYFAGREDILCARDIVNSMGYYAYIYGGPTEYTSTNEDYRDTWYKVENTAYNILYLETFDKSSAFFY